MSERFVYVRGDGARHRVMHLAAYDRLGRYAGPLCGIGLPFNTSCNLPLARPVCKRCRKEEVRLMESHP